MPLSATLGDPGVSSRGCVPRVLRVLESLFSARSQNAKLYQPVGDVGGNITLLKPRCHAMTGSALVIEGGGRDNVGSSDRSGWMP